MTDQERMRIGLPEPGPTRGQPGELEWLRRTQAQCVAAMRLYPENADWHRRGHDDYLMEECLLLIENKTAPETKGQGNTG